MRGPGIRLMEERRDAESGEMTDEQFAFVRAVDDWKLRNRRPYPTLTEILAVAKTLGYRLGELRAAAPIEPDEPPPTTRLALGLPRIGGRPAAVAENGGDRSGAGRRGRGK